MSELDDRAKESAADYIRIQYLTEFEKKVLASLPIAVPQEVMPDIRKIFISLAVARKQLKEVEKAGRIAARGEVMQALDASWKRMLPILRKNGVSDDFIEGYERAMGNSLGDIRELAAIETIKKEEE